MFTLIALTFLAASDKEIGDFALTKAPTFVSMRLKSPAKAEYSVAAVAEEPPSNTLVPNRHMVYGNVDSANSFGAVLRTKWRMVVHVHDAGMTMLSLDLSDGNGIQHLYKAPADVRYRKEIITKVMDDFLKAKSQFQESMKRLPVSRKKMMADRFAAKAIAEGKKYGLTAMEMNDILGFNKK
jgi:hypothetical protein